MCAVVAPGRTAGMVRAARAGRAGRVGPGGPGRRRPSSASACPSAADEPDGARAGAGARARARARVAAALVGGGDPQERPDLVAGGRRGREKRAPGRPGGTAGEAAAWGDARSASGRAGPRFSLHLVRPAAAGLNPMPPALGSPPRQGPGVRRGRAVGRSPWCCPSDVAGPASPAEGADARPAPGTAVAPVRRLLAGSDRTGALGRPAPGHP